MGEEAVVVGVAVREPFLVPKDSAQTMVAAATREGGRETCVLQTFAVALVADSPWKAVVIVGFEKKDDGSVACPFAEVLFPFLVAEHEDAAWDPHARHAVGTGHWERDQTDILDHHGVDFLTNSDCEDCYSCHKAPMAKQTERSQSGGSEDGDT